MGSDMKAMVFYQYGLSDVLQYEEVEKPVPKDNEVLIKVYAASINSWDWELLQGKPFVNRLMFGIQRPKKINILGCDIAGKIEAVGRAVKKFKVGDEVFGDLSGGLWGGFAEYDCASEDVLAIKPPDMAFEEAAAIPQAGLLALQGLRQGKIQQEQLSPPQKILINGASGGSGSFAVQIAKSFGAVVTGVCRTEKIDFVLSIGADHVIDYTQQDFTKNGQQYDLILDAQAFHSMFDVRRSLTLKGSYVIHGGGSSQLFQAMLLGSLTSKIGSQKIGVLLHKPNVDDLYYMTKLYRDGKVKPIIDKSFPLSKGAEAMRYYADGNTKGKVVISMEENL